MIAAILLVAMLQAEPLPPEVWKERNLPDMPVLPPCALGDGIEPVYSIRQLPSEAVTELERFFDDAIPMSDAGGPFNSTDVVGNHVPRRRFLRAYEAGPYWVVWYELGGLVSGPRTIAVTREEPRGNRASTFRVAPGTVFAGDLCIATRAILSGVRGASF